MGGKVAEPYRLLIGGEWTDGSAGSYAVINPATEEVVAEAPEASAGDALSAAAAARRAQPGWAATSPQERARLLQAVADRIRQRQAELLPVIIAETGATLSVGSALQVPMCANRFERYAKGALQDLSIPLAW
jgi:phenylacetaldehyde dehydrogenase